MSRRQARQLLSEHRVLVNDRPVSIASREIDESDRISIAGEERPVVRGGKIEIAHMMSVTLSCDHRAIDGALGAELIGAFKMLIENPVMMMV